MYDSVQPWFQVLSYSSALFGLASRIKKPSANNLKTDLFPHPPFFFLAMATLFLLPFLSQTDCCPGCINVQTVSSPLHLNPYGIKVKGILSSDYSSNLLNNVLLPSFSAAAEIPPSLMIQPPSRTTVFTLPPSISLSPSIPAFPVLSFLVPEQRASVSTLILREKKEDRGDSTQMT